MEYDVFVSYSRRDSDIVEKVIKELTRHNISVWIDKDGVESGDAFKSVIVKAIKNANVFLFFSSKSSNESPWTVKEVNTAVYLKKYILPIKLDATVYNDSILFDLGGLSFVDYYVNPEVGLTEVIKSVKSHKEESNQIDIKKIREEIAQLEKDGLRLFAEQKRIADLINAKKNQIGEHEQTCPVCGQQNKLSVSFCPNCGWTYIPFQSAKLDEKRLKAFRELWKKKGEVTNQPEIAPLADTSLSYHVKQLLSEMILVEGGTFMMGGTEEQGEDAFNDEMPAHKVTLSSFYISKFPIRQILWKEVMGDNPSHFKGEMLPVENVSWFDCQDFVLKLSQMSGKHFRLPTEAEWEFAARGGNKSRHTKYSGSDNLDEVGWYNENGEGRTHLPGEKKPNELGLYDMSGNVWEWVQDWKGDYSEEHQTDPKGLPIGDERICRGGGWNRERDRARVSYRGDDLPDLRYCTLGLRVVMEN